MEPKPYQTPKNKYKDIAPIKLTVREKEQVRSNGLPLWAVCQVNPKQFFWAYWTKGTDATSPTGVPTAHGIAESREESIRLAKQAGGPTSLMGGSREAIRAFQGLNKTKK